MKTKERSGLFGVGLLSAFAASLCCITPILALITGTFGIASSFSWVEPARPYLIAITVIVLAFAWYQQLSRKSKEEENCRCERNSFMKSTKALLVITLFSGLLLAFPYYASALYETPARSTSVQQQSNLKSVNFSVTGMTCISCTAHIDGALSKVFGVAKSSTSYEKAETRVNYDPKKVSVDSLKSQINRTGYQVTGFKIK
ncbi:mercuric transport protein MerTP [Pedobacter immunditicola]|uniref:mercuric transport protein MerTP n=1 Tax=Pedobacter immunditicola TaxID=3133440 RepID=UPI0030A98D1C